MTIASAELKSAEVRGASSLTVGFQSVQGGDSLQRVIAANPVTGKLAIFGLNDTNTRVFLQGESLVMDPPPTRTTVTVSASPVFYVICPKTASKPGKIHEFVYALPNTPSKTVEDPEASGDILVTNAGQWLLHTRSSPGTLVVRNPVDLSVVAEHICCENPLRIVRYQDKVYVFGAESNDVWIFKQDPGGLDGIIRFDSIVTLPFAQRVIDVAVYSNIMQYVTGDRFVQCLLEQDISIGRENLIVVQLIYHDPWGSYTSVDAFSAEQTIVRPEFATDPEYAQKLEKYRFSQGRDRAVRDPWDSRHFLGLIRTVVGTSNGIAEGTRHPWDRAVVREVGKSRIAMDPVNGRMIIYGSLSFWFRSLHAAGLAPAVADADVEAGGAVTLDAARGLRMIWQGNPQWKREPTINKRAAFLDGETMAVAGSLKEPFLPGIEGSTAMAWIYHTGSIAADAGLNVIFASSENPLYSGFFYYNPFLQQVKYLGLTVASGNLTGAWHHVAAVADAIGGTTKIYIDGVLVGTGGGAVWDPYNSFPFTLGGYLDVDGEPAGRFTGWLGDVLMYNTPKDASFIAEVFSRGVGGRPPATE